MSKPYLSLIMPVRDEEKTILHTLLALDYVLSISEFSFEVIIVDDGSRDGTVNVVRQYEKVLKQLRCVERKSSGGSGAAIKEGMAMAHGNIRLVLFPSCVGFLDKREEIIAAFKNGSDLVVGSRNKGNEPLPAKRAIKRSLRRMGNTLLCGKLLKNVSDVRFGAMCMTEEVATWLFSFSELSDSNDIFFELHVLSMANGFKLQEVEYETDEFCSCGRGVWDWVRTFISALRVRYLAKKKKREERAVVE